MLVADTSFVVLKAIAKRKSLILFMIMNRSRKIPLADWLFSVRFLLFEKKIWLSSPTMHGDEQKWINNAFEKNWITMAGVEGVL